MRAEPSTETLSFEEFERAGAAWGDLVAASHAATPFVSHPWLCLWWRHFGRGQEFVAPVVRDGETLLAGVPLALRRACGTTVAEIVGTGPVPTRGMGLADKADLVVRRDAPAAWPRLAGVVTRLLERVAVLDLKGLDEGSPTPSRLTPCAPRPGSVRTLARSVSPYLVLPASWDEYLGSRSGGFRKHLRKYRRLLEQAGAMEIVRLEPDQPLEAWLSEVVAVNQASWTAGRGTNLFRHPRIRAFLLDLLRETARQGWLDLHVLRVGGRAVAYELCFDFAGRVFSYNSAYRRELGRASPGTLLTAAVIEAACRRGRTEYDMLRGDEAYKARWSDRRRGELQLLLPAARPLARLYCSLGIQAKARLRSSRRLADLADRLRGVKSRFDSFREGL
jgi:CelD/BcsL family acetyltransferase involved in cellulose biosynthesis